MVTGDWAVGYVRVSTGEQAESGAGLEAQRRGVRLECDRRSWELVAIHEDADASGKSLKGRPALAAAIEQVESGEASGIVVSKLDRLSRSLLDFAELILRATKEGLESSWRLTSGSIFPPHPGKFIANVMASEQQSGNARSSRSERRMG